MVARLSNPSPIHPKLPQERVGLTFRGQICCRRSMGDVKLMHQSTITSNFMKCPSQRVAPILSWKGMDHHTLRLPKFPPSSVAQREEVRSRFLHQASLDLLRNSLKSRVLINKPFQPCHFWILPRFKHNLHSLGLDLLNKLHGYGLWHDR